MAEAHGDLALVAACLAGDAAALAEFDRRFGGELDRIAAKAGTSGLTAAEFRQQVYAKLFVAPARARQYGGRGDLLAWVRVVAGRMVVDVLREQAGVAEVPLLDDDAGSDDDDDLELELLRARYSEPLARALESAFAELTPRQRNLLRYRLLRGYDHEQLAQVYGVHRTSVARWLVDARRELVQRAKDMLRHEQGIALGDVDSLVRAVQSRVELTLSRVLARDPESEG